MSDNPYKDFLSASSGSPDQRLARHVPPHDTEFAHARRWVLVQEREHLVLARGGRVLTCPLLPDRSTTKIIEKSRGG